jgi:4-hydroxybenzoate polyprenyltransferase
MSSLERDATKRRPRLLALLVAMRPKQWVKNVWVLAALVLTGGLFDPDRALRVFATFAYFSFASSAVYLLNDMVDREGDRNHPRKKFRPFASGELGILEGALAAVLLAFIALFGAFRLSGGLTPDLTVGWIVLAYLLLQLAYSFVLKHMIIVDVMTIAGGFLFRVLAGGAAIEAEISAYLYLSTIFLALFQGFAKRRSELSQMAEDAGAHRPSLDEYTIELLDNLLVVTASATIVTYAVYAVEAPFKPEDISVNLLLLTVPFVVYAVLRYLYLVQVKGMGGAPEEILLADRLFLLDVLAWAGMLLLILYFRP